MQNNSLKKAIHHMTLKNGIVTGSDLLRDFGFAKAPEVLEAVSDLFNNKAIHLNGLLQKEDPNSVFHVTISVRPSNRTFSQMLFTQTYKKFI